MIDNAGSYANYQSKPSCVFTPINPDFATLYVCVDHGPAVSFPHRHSQSLCSRSSVTRGVPRVTSGTGRDFPSVAPMGDTPVTG